MDSVSLQILLISISATGILLTSLLLARRNYDTSKHYLHEALPEGDNGSPVKTAWKSVSANDAKFLAADLPGKELQPVEDWLPLNILPDGAPADDPPATPTTETTGPESPSNGQGWTATLPAPGASDLGEPDSSPAPLGCSNASPPAEVAWLAPTPQLPELFGEVDSRSLIESEASLGSPEPDGTTDPVIEEVAPAPNADGTAAEAAAPPVQESVEAGIPPLPPGGSSDAALALPALLRFFALSEQPFGVTPDPAYLYLSQMHRQAFSSLASGIQNLRGFMALIAEPGMGKTTLLNKLRDELRDASRTLFLFQTQCDSREFLRYLLSELGVRKIGTDPVSMQKQLNALLFREMLDGRRFVLIIDEAQNLRETTLETIRLLSDFETSHAKLIQIVLAGQPHLAVKLMRPSLSQLRQRIALLAKLEPLSAAETARYIEHRLKVAGSNGTTIFAPDALVLIARRSQGIPRTINNLCFNALVLAFAQGRETITADIVQEVAARLDLEPLVSRPQARDSALPPAPEAPVPPGSPQSTTQPLPDLAAQSQSDAERRKEKAPKTVITLTGKMTGLARSRPWSKEKEFRVQISLERGPSSEIPVAERYYCCNLYLPEDQAKVFRSDQPIRIRIEQD